MNGPAFPVLAVLLFLGVVAFLFWVLVMGTLRGLKGVRHPNYMNVLYTVVVALLAFLSLEGLLASRGTFARFDALPPPIVFPLIVSVLAIGMLAVQRSVGELLDVLPLGALIWPQGVRMVVEIVLWLLGEEGIAPPQMTWEGMNYDVVAGITAPLVAWVAFGGGRQLRWLGIVWNLVGLGLLLNIVTVAILSTPTFGVFVPSNTFVAYWPMIWLPGFVVPVALLLHVLSLRQILRRK